MGGTKNRAHKARVSAGLSLANASRMLGLEIRDLSRAEVFDDAFAALEDRDRAKMAELYHVRPEWLAGEVPERDYAKLDTLPGADKLTSRDRDIFAEAVASLPRKP